MYTEDLRAAGPVVLAIAAGICLGLALSFTSPLTSSAYVVPRVQVQPAVHARLVTFGAVPPSAQAVSSHVAPLKAYDFGAEDTIEANPSGSSTANKWMLATAFPLFIFSVVNLYKRLVAGKVQRSEEESDWMVASAAGNVKLQYTAEIPVKDVSGSAAGTTELCLRTAGPNSRHVIHRKLVAEFANRRQSNAHTKTRAEVSGGGKKPYKQKGTGNARRGSNRSPLMRHGGVAFGPRNTKNYKQKINKKEGRLAISSLIQNRAPLITVIKDLENSMNVVSTKKAAEMVETWKDQEKGDKVLLVIDVDGKPPATHPLVLSTNNLAKVKLMTQQQLAVADLLWPHQIFVSDKALDSLKQRFEVPVASE